MLCAGGGGTSRSSAQVRAQLERASNLQVTDRKDVMRCDAKIILKLERRSSTHATRDRRAVRGEPQRIDCGNAAAPVSPLTVLFVLTQRRRSTPNPPRNAILQKHLRAQGTRAARFTKFHDYPVLRQHFFDHVPVDVGEAE